MLVAQAQDLNKAVVLWHVVYLVAIMHALAMVLGARANCK